MLTILLNLILTLGSVVYICQAEGNEEEEKRVWCDADAIAKLHEGNVTCSFPMDLRGDDIVGIRHYTDTSDKLIMDCSWDKLPDQCNSLRPPYKVVKVTGRTLKLKVSNISVPHLTTYRCSLWDGTDMYHSPFCAMLIHPDPFAVASGGLTSTAANLDQPSKRQDKHCDSEEGLSGGAVAGYVICAVIIVVLSAVIGFLCYREKRRYIRESPKKDEEEALLRRRTQATIEDPNEVSAEPMLPVNSACGQNSHGTPTETRPSTEKDVMGKGERDPLNGDTASSGFPHPYSYGSHGTPTETRPSTEKDVMGKGERDPLNGDTASSGFPPPHSNVRQNRRDDKAKGGGG